MNLIEHLTRQIAFSRATFGPAERTAGVIDHIRKELVEIAGPAPLTEIERLVLQIVEDPEWDAETVSNLVTPDWVESVREAFDRSRSKERRDPWGD
jgi:hypothetical protein